MKLSKEIRKMKKAIHKYRRYSIRIVRESDEFKAERKAWYATHKHHARVNTIYHWMHKNKEV